MFIPFLVHYALRLCFSQMLRLADDVGTRHEVSLSLSLPLLPLSLPTRKWRSLEKLEARAISMLCAHGARVARYALRVC